jgi:two-component system, sensor histidine kinase and response regulator
MRNGSPVAGDIMIVDDNPANLKLLEEMLEIQGHEVRAFPLGRLALAASVKHPPDLILMDVNMPEMDGYEACQLLKASEAGAGIPVIFLSALTETSDKVKAFQCGAADYITKPFQVEEVHSRVQTHLQLHNLQRALRRENDELEEAVAARTRELSEANSRLTIVDRSKSDFLTLISHEFRTPLNGLLGVSEIIMEGLPPSVQGEELRQMYKGCRDRIISILDDAFLITEIDVAPQRFKMAPVSLCSAIKGAVDTTSGFAETRQVTVIPGSKAMQPFLNDSVLANDRLLARAFQALLETAIKFAEKGTTVRIRREATPDSLKVIVDSNGSTIPTSSLEKFFDILAIGDALLPGGDLGLSPAISHRIFSLFDAPLSVADRDGAGIRLTVAFKQIR